MRDNKTRLCLASNDEVAKVAIVVLDIALSCSQRQTLFNSD